MKAPNIYVVLKNFYDYGLTTCEPVAWFFDEREAEKWAESQDKSTYHYEVEEVPPGDES